MGITNGPPRTILSINTHPDNAYVAPRPPQPPRTVWSINSDPVGQLPSGPPAPAAVAPLEETLFGDAPSSRP